MMTQGAQAGAAFGPWGAAIGGAAGLVGDIATAPDTGVSLSGAGQFDLRSAMDGSGWTVSTGSSRAEADNRRSQAADAGVWGTGTPGVQMAGMSSNPLMLAMLLGLFVVFIKRGKL